MLRLDANQHEAVYGEHQLVVTACPGSGKTRVLAARVLRSIELLDSKRQRVVALTFTNRAADELRSRVERMGVEPRQLWTGTIHAFALHWVLRPYAAYVPECRSGFHVADEFLSRSILDEERDGSTLDRFYQIDLGYLRDGTWREAERVAIPILEAYKLRLREALKNPLKSVQIQD